MSHFKNTLILLFLVSCVSKKYTTIEIRKIDLVVKLKNYNDSINYRKIHYDTAITTRYTISFKEGLTDTTELASLYLDSVELGKLYGGGISSVFLVQLYSSLINKQQNYGKAKQKSN